MARILVIEDEKDIQDVLEYNLRQAGHKVNLASTGQDGLKLAREKKPDLVLLDLMLPDISGTEVCKALKQDAATRDIQVLILTAKGEEIDRVVGFELGADIIKTYYTGSADSFRRVVENCPVPVMIAGGTKMNTVRAALEVVHGSIQAGGKGVVFGRNIWQSPVPRAIVTALKAIIHGGQSVDAAMAEARLAG